MKLKTIPLIPKKSSYIQAYTLVEVLVAMMIMIILFTVSSARLREFQRRKSLESAAEEVKKDLRFAQELAFAGNKPQAGNCSLPNSTLDSYIFRRQGSNSYRIIANCSGGTDIVKTVTLQTGFQIQGGIGPGNEIFFYVLGRGASPATVTVRWPGSGISDIDIDVTKEGTIQ